MAGEAYRAPGGTVQTLDMADPYQEDRVFLCIDLKSFYASVECVARGLDPFTTNLIVADPDRTEKTICLAITPAMKALGVKNRCRVFEIPKSVDFIMAKPRMKKYMEVSAQIYQVYLEYIAPEAVLDTTANVCFVLLIGKRRSVVANGMEIVCANLAVVDVALQYVKVVLLSVSKQFYENHLVAEVVKNHYVLI